MHRGERDGQLRERGSLERAARHRQQLERRRDVGDWFGANRVVGDQEGGELGDLREGGADVGGVAARLTRADARGAEGTGGMRGHTRQRVGEF